MDSAERNSNSHMMDFQVILICRRFQMLQQYNYNCGTFMLTLLNTMLIDTIYYYYSRL